MGLNHLWVVESVWAVERVRGLNWSGLLNQYGLVVLVVLGCVRWLRLL